MFILGKRKQQKRVKSQSLSEASSAWLFDMVALEQPSPRRSQLCALLKIVVNGITDDLQTSTDLPTSSSKVTIEDFVLRRVFPLIPYSIDCASQTTAPYCTRNDIYDLQDFVNIPRRRLRAILSVLFFGTRYLEKISGFSENSEWDVFVMIQCLCRDLLNMMTPQGAIVLQSVNAYLAKMKVRTLGSLPPLRVVLSLLRRSRLTNDSVRFVDGTNFIGMGQPDSTLIRETLRFLREVKQASVYLMFEVSRFTFESEAWRDVCWCYKLQFSPTICDLIFDSCEEAMEIEIIDWTVPPETALVTFAKTLIASRRRNLTVVGHCIAGHGRTGFMIMFVLMFWLKIFDFSQLLLELSRRYIPEASLEVLNLVQDRRRPHSIGHIILRFIAAFKIVYGETQLSRSGFWTEITLVEAQGKEQALLRSNLSGKQSFPENEAAELKRLIRADREREHNLPSYGLGGDSGEAWRETVKRRQDEEEQPNVESARLKAKAEKAWNARAKAGVAEKRRQRLKEAEDAAKAWNARAKAGVAEKRRQRLKEAEEEELRKEELHDEE
jgi:hypothetical protein